MMKLILFVIGVGLLFVGIKAYPLLPTLPGPLSVLAVVPKQGYMGLGGLLALVSALWNLLCFFRKRPTQRQFVPVESSDEDEQGEVRPPRQTVPVRRETQRSTAKKGGFFGLSWFAVAGIVLVTTLFLITLLQFGTGGTAVVPKQVQSPEQPAIIEIAGEKLVQLAPGLKCPGPEDNRPEFQPAEGIFAPAEFWCFGPLSEQDLQNPVQVVREFPVAGAIEVDLPTGRACVAAPSGYAFEQITVVKTETEITPEITPEPTPVSSLPPEETKETNPLIYFFIGVGGLIVIGAGVAAFLAAKGVWVVQIPRDQQAYIENRFFGTARFEGAGTKPYIPIAEKVSLFPGPNTTVDIAIPNYPVDYKATVEQERLADEGKIELTDEGLIDGSFDIVLRVMIEDVTKLVQTIEDAAGTWENAVKGIARGVAYEMARRHTFLEFDKLLEDMRRELRVTLVKYGIGLDLLRLENADVADEYRRALQQYAVQTLTATADRDYMNRTGMTPETFVQKVAAERGGLLGQLPVWLQQLLTIPKAPQSIPQPVGIKEVTDEQSTGE